MIILVQTQYHLINGKSYKSQISILFISPILFILSKKQITKTTN